MSSPNALQHLSPTDRFFAENLQAMRKESGLSQEALAEKMHDQGFPKYSQMAVSRIEKGQRTVGLTEARALASILETSTEQMASPPESVRSITEILEHHRYLQETIGSIAKGMYDSLFALSLAEKSLAQIERVELDKHLPPDVAGRVRQAEDYIRRLKGGGLNMIMFEANRMFTWQVESENPVDDASAS